MTTRRRIARRPTAVGRPRLTWRMFQADPFTLVGGTRQIFNLGVNGVGSSLALLGIVGDYTIRRVRWHVGIHDTDAFTTVREVLVYWGMTVVSIDAFLAGPGSLPDPRTDSADWFGYGVLTYITENLGNFFGWAPNRIAADLDVRSMRKVNENNEAIALVFSTVAGEQAEVAFGGRLLVSHGRQ